MHNKAMRLFLYVCLLYQLLTGTAAGNHVHSVDAFSPSSEPTSRPTSYDTTKSLKFSTKWINFNTTAAASNRKATTLFVNSVNQYIVDVLLIRTAEFHLVSPENFTTGELDLQTECVIRLDSSNASPSLCQVYSQLTAGLYQAVDWRYMTPYIREQAEQQNIPEMKGVVVYEVDYIRPSICPYDPVTSPTPPPLVAPPRPTKAPVIKPSKAPVAPTAPVPTTPSAPTAPSTPTSPTAPVSTPTVPAGPTAPAAPTAPVSPTVPTAPTTPTAPVTVPTAPATPTTPTAPVAPAAPTTPTAPTAPVSPTVPTAPTTVPTAPATPTTPTAPVAPTIPTAPVTAPITAPTAPVAPFAPTTPTAPTTPIAPSSSAPVTPTSPVVPTVPVTPTAPTAPTAPTTPTSSAPVAPAPTTPVAPTAPTAPTAPAPTALPPVGVQYKAILTLGNLGATSLTSAGISALTSTLASLESTAGTNIEYLQVRSVAFAKKEIIRAAAFTVHEEELHQIVVATRVSLSTGDYISSSNPAFANIGNNGTRLYLASTKVLNTAIANHQIDTVLQSQAASKNAAEMTSASVLSVSFEDLVIANPASNSASSQQAPLSAGAYIGIVIGSLCFFALLILIIYFGYVYCIESNEDDKVAGTAAGGGIRRAFSFFSSGATVDGENQRKEAGRDDRDTNVSLANDEALSSRKRNNKGGVHTAATMSASFSQSFDFELSDHRDIVVDLERDGFSFTDDQDDYSVNQNYLPTTTAATVAGKPSKKKHHHSKKDRNGGGYSHSHGHSHDSSSSNGSSHRHNRNERMSNGTPVARGVDESYYYTADTRM
jgi:hypothetical protein